MNMGLCHFDCPRSEQGNWLVTTRKTFQRPSRHVLHMALLAVSPWFASSDVFAQVPTMQPNGARPTTPPPAQTQNLPPAVPSTSPGNVDARLQIYDVPLEYVGEVGGRIQAQFGADKRVRVTNEPNTGRLMVLAPDGTQTQIAQVVEAARRQIGSLNLDMRGNVIPSTIQQNQYKLQRISWRELEDAVGRLAGSRLTISTSNNGELAQLKLVTKDSVQEVMQVDRRNNEVRLQGTPASVMGWTQVITAIDIGQADPARPTQIIPINPATPERIERAIKLIKLASYQQPGQPPLEDEATTTAQVRPGTGGNDRATIVASPDAISSGSGLIGDVDISFVPEMGLVIIKGSKRDVQRVQEVIEQIKKQSTETQPEIEIVPLKHVNGQALEVIIKDLNTKVFSPRQGQIEITALGQPNALLLIGRVEAMVGIKQLIEKLDVPLDPNSQLRIFKLINSSAVDAETLIRSFFTEAPGANQTERIGLGTRVKIIADYRTNSLIVQASPRDQAEVARLVEEIDSETTPAENEIKVFPIKNAIASELQPILQTAITGQAPAAAGGGNQATTTTSRATPPSSRLSIIPRDGKSVDSGILAGVVVTTNASINALVVRAPKKSMALIAALIEQLDQAPSAEARIKVFPVKNGDATALTTVLQQVFGIQSTAANANNAVAAAIGLQNLAALTGGGDSSLVPLRVSTDSRTNTIIVSGSPSDVDVIEVLLIRLDEEGGQARSTEVVWLRNSSATDVASALTRLFDAQRQNITTQLATQGGAGAQISVYERIDREVFVFAEPATNSLVISATPRYMPQISQVIERLDRQQPMISVEILIAEVTLDDQFEMGSEFGLQDSLLFDRNSASGGTLSSPAFNNNAAFNTASPQRRPQNVAGQGFTGFGLGRSNTGLGYGGLVLAAGSESVNILIRALQDANRIQILSRPQLTTIDNNIAVVQVGADVPRFAGQTQTQFGVQNNVSDVPVGLIMQIQPRTNQDGLVNMIVAINRSSVGPTDTGIPVGFGVNGDVIRSPIINKTVAQTRVTAYDGQTIVLGGLITKTRSTRSRRIPFLADIPLAGALFRFESEFESRTELLVVMTPRVITFNDAGKLDMIKQVESSRMSWCMADVLNIHGDVGLSLGNGLWGPAASPVIYPDLQPTVDFENDSGPRSMILGEPEQINGPSGVEMLEGYPINSPVRSSSKGARTLIDSSTNGTEQPSVNSALPIQNSSYQQSIQQGAYGVAPASYQPISQPAARIANGR